MAAIYLLTRSNFFCILSIAIVWVLVVRLVLSDRWPCFLMSFLWWSWWLTGHFSFHTHQVKCSSCLLLEILWLSWSMWDLENISKSLKSPLGLLQQWYNHHVLCMHSFVDDNDGFAGYFSLHTHQVKCSSSCLLLEIFYDFPDLYKDLMKHLQKFQISSGTFATVIQSSWETNSDSLASLVKCLSFAYFSYLPIWSTALPSFILLLHAVHYCVFLLLFWVPVCTGICSAHLGFVPVRYQPTLPILSIYHFELVLVCSGRYPLKLLLLSIKSCLLYHACWQGSKAVYFSIGTYVNGRR